jgi:hypothetical protein
VDIVAEERNLCLPSHGAGPGAPKLTEKCYKFIRTHVTCGDAQCSHNWQRPIENRRRKLKKGKERLIRTDFVHPGNFGDLDEKMSMQN